MGSVEPGREVADFEQGQGLTCIDEQLQPLHGLCSRTVVISMNSRLWSGENHIYEG